MKRYDEIQRLADRFLDGHTSLAEERELASFFSTHKAEIPSMPASLQVLAEMMEGFAIAAETMQNGELIIENAPKRPVWRRWRWIATAAAACVAAVLAIALWPTDNSDAMADAQPDQQTIQEIDEASTAPITEDNSDELLAKEETETPAKPTPLHSPTRIAQAAVDTPVQTQAATEPAPDPEPIPMACYDVEDIIQACDLALLEAEFQRYKQSVTYVQI